MARRDAGRPRGAPIEDAVLNATLHELSEYGLDGANIGRIAKAADVNKTSVYRRWGSREALVAAALERALRQLSGAVQDTGSLRGDLLQLMRLVTDRLIQPTGQALVRAAMDKRTDNVARMLSNDAAVREQVSIVEMIQRAIERGEWDPRRPPDVVLAMIVGGIIHRVMMERRPVDDDVLQTMVDVTVRGVRPS